MPPAAPAQVGRAAILAALSQSLKIDSSRTTVTTESVTASGAVAIEIGAYVSVPAAAPPGTAPDSGKFLAHWHLADGKWQIAELLLNSNRPPAPSPQPPAKKK